MLESIQHLEATLLGMGVTVDRSLVVEAARRHQRDENAQVIAILDEKKSWEFKEKERKESDEAYSGRPNVATRRSRRHLPEADDEDEPLSQRARRMEGSTT